MIERPPSRTPSPPSAARARAARQRRWRQRQLALTASGSAATLVERGNYLVNALRFPLKGSPSNRRWANALTANRTLAPPLQHQALATSGQATAHRIPSVRYVFGEGGSHPCHRGGPRESHIKAITSCSISGIYSPSAKFVTATARSSRRHTVTNGTSGLTVGLPTRTIPRISLALKGLANQGMVLEHVDGCLWGARHPPIRSLIDENSWAWGGLRKN